MPANNVRYKIESAIFTAKGLEVEWRDGHQSQFHPVWLRHQCGCSFCGLPITGLRGIRLHHIPENIDAGIIEFDVDNISLKWSGDDHLSGYAATWLRDHCYSDVERTRRRHQPTLWDGAIAADPPLADMTKAEADIEARLRLLKQVRDYGFCKIINTPTGADEASRLINLLGPQRITHYGTYMLSSKDKADNVGDVTHELDPHADETYRLSTIGITVFQVLRPSASGGQSTLVDGFEAVRRLRDAWPDDFDLLTRTPIAGERRDAAHNSGGLAKWYSATLPIIRTDFFGEVSGVRLNERQIAPLDMPSELIGPCYRALRRLFDILYDPELRLTFALEAGEGLIFDNQRVLHGRTAFEIEESPRSVLTSSVDIEEFHSSLRMLQEQVEGNTPPVRLTQGMVA